MKLNLFKKDNCKFCDQLVIPENLKVNVINIDESYGGFVPHNVPVLQINGLNLEGPPVINTILAAIADDDNKK